MSFQLFFQQRLKWSLPVVLLTASLTSASCSGKEPQSQKQTGTDLQISRFTTEKGSYRVGESVKASGWVVNNHEFSAEITTLKVMIRNLSDDSRTFFHEQTLLEGADVHPADSLQVGWKEVWTVPAATKKGPYGIYVEYTLSSDTTVRSYQSFFSVVDNDSRTTYEIVSERHDELPVFKLRGGMSAEYTVEKSLASLASGISQSWAVSAPGYGPHPVTSTPAFLEESVRNTVDAYDEVLGPDAAIETVVIGTGIPSAAYLCRTMKAAFLPIHFLAGINTVKEVQSMVDHANATGFKSYAAAGYDPSVAPAVAWIKLLDLPALYLDFIQRHQVKKVVLLGYNGSADGENRARKIVDGRGSYDPGSVYLLHPGGGTSEDVSHLRSKYKDYDEQVLSDFTRITDWESGLTNQQADSFSRTLQSHTAVDETWFISSANDIPLWDLATYVSLAFIRKNETAYKSLGGSLIKGVSINPYLIGHPFFESRMQYIPLLYWQGNPATSTADRLLNTTKRAIESYFPETTFETLSFWINSTNNFGGAQQAQALLAELGRRSYENTVTNQLTADEVWNPADGMDSPCEVRAALLLQSGTAGSLADWEKNLTPLTLEDLKELVVKFPELVIQKK